MAWWLLSYDACWSFDSLVFLRVKSTGNFNSRPEENKTLHSITHELNDIQGSERFIQYEHLIA